MTLPFLPLKNTKGFTLVELLIVVTLIAILAVAVLATVNPIEQFNKARDTVRKGDAVQVLNAIERYYTTNERYPWNALASPPDYDTDGAFGANADNINVGVCGADCDSDGVLISSGELKTDFRGRNGFENAALTRAVYDNIFVIKSLNSTDLNVCYIPASQSVRSDQSSLKQPVVATDGVTVTPPGAGASIAACPGAPLLDADWTAFDTACYVCVPE